MFSRIASYRFIRYVPRVMNRNMRFALSRSICCSTTLSPHFRRMPLRYDEQMNNFVLSRQFSLEGNSLSSMQSDLRECNSFDAAVDMIPVEVHLRHLPSRDSKVALLKRI